MSTYVSVGRNVGDEPMPLDRWMDFLYDVRLVIEEWAGDVATVAEGVGEWNDEREDTAILVSYSDPIWGREGFERALAALAREYGQEAIALVVAEPTFVSSSMR